MIIDLTTNEIGLLMELIQNWKTHRTYNTEEINIINNIVKKISYIIKPKNYKCSACGYKTITPAEDGLGGKFCPQCFIKHSILSMMYVSSGEDLNNRSE